MGNDYNYYALLVSILTGYTQEQAFEMLDTGNLPKIVNWTPGMREDLEILRSEGVSYRELAETFGTSKDSIHCMLKRIRKSKKGA